MMPASGAAGIVAEVRAAGLLAAERPVVVLYSGGRDSTCLVDLAARIAGPGAVSAVHVNYGMREGAEADERHCIENCERLGIALEISRPRWESGSAGNVQAWARRARYAAADALAQVRDADIAAGHTATDQVETILYRLASSPSRRALLGMRARDGRLVRPLLGFTRARTQAYCEARGLCWRDDPTNDGDAYARGRVRHELVPALRRIHPAAEANVLALARTLAEEAAVLDELVESVLEGRDVIAVARLRALAPALRRLVVQRLADGAVGGPAAGVARRADEVAAMSDRGTAMLDLPAHVRATARGGLVSFSQTPVLGALGADAEAPAPPANSVRSAHLD